MYVEVCQLPQHIMSSWYDVCFLCTDITILAVVGCILRFASCPNTLSSSCFLCTDITILPVVECMMCFLCTDITILPVVECFLCTDITILPVVECMMCFLCTDIIILPVVGCMYFLRTVQIYQYCQWWSVCRCFLCPDITVVECMLFCVCTDITILPAVEGVFSVYRYNNTASGGVYDVFSVYRYNNTASGGVYVEVCQLPKHKTEQLGNSIPWGNFLLFYKSDLLCILPFQAPFQPLLLVTHKISAVHIVSVYHMVSFLSLWWAIVLCFPTTYFYLDEKSLSGL